MSEIPEKESLSCIFHECTPDYLRSGIYDDVTALSNSEGGSIYVGVAKDGTVVGMEGDPEAKTPLEDPATLCSRISRHTVPPISLTAELLDGERPVLQVTIPRSADGLTATKDGRVLKRRISPAGVPESAAIYPCNFPLQFTAARMPDYTEMPLRLAAVEDFDPLHIERLRWILETNSHDVSLQGLSNDELFRALGFVQEVEGKLHPTVTGLLLIGRFEALQRHVPTAKAQIVVTQGTTTHLDEEYLMPIPAAMERFTYTIHIDNPVHEMRLGLYRKKVPDFDEDALHEATLNAFIHRDYSRMGCVAAHIFDEGITVTNPGSLPEDVQDTNLLNAQPYCINPTLARAVRRIGLKGNSKRGIDIIFEGALKYGSQLPEYYSPDPHTLSIFFPRIQPNKDIIGLITKYRSDFERSLSIQSLLVVNALNEMPRSRVHEIAEFTHLPQGIVRASIGHLIQLGIAQVREGTSGRTYSLTSYVPGLGQRHEELVREDSRTSDIDAILDMARDKEFITNMDVARLLETSSSKSYRLLKKLAEDGYLEPINKGRYAKYRLVAKKKK